MFDDDTVSVCTCEFALWSLKVLVTEKTRSDLQPSI